MARTTSILFAAFLIAFAASSANADDDDGPKCLACPIPQPQTPGCALIPFIPTEGVVGGLSGYEYGANDTNGPANWANLDCQNAPFDVFANCSYCTNDCAGVRQSPIDFKPKDAIKSPINVAPRFILAKSAEMQYVIKPLNYEMSCAKGWCGTGRFDGVFFRLINIHFHTPSEHTVDGKQYPLEMHLVHISSAGTALVLGAFFEEGEANPALQGYLDIGENRCQGKVDVMGMVGTARQRWRFLSYLGGLTTPPCSEIVRFAISTNVQTASKEQIEQYKRQVGGGVNARPVQPLNQRIVQSFN